MLQTTKQYAVLFLTNLVVKHIAAYAELVEANEADCDRYTTPLVTTITLGKSIMTMLLGSSSNPDVKSF